MSGTGMYLLPVSLSQPLSASPGWRNVDEMSNPGTKHGPKRNPGHKSAHLINNALLKISREKKHENSWGLRPSRPVYGHTHRCSVSLSFSLIVISFLLRGWIQLHTQRYWSLFFVWKKTCHAMPYMHFWMNYLSSYRPICSMQHLVIQNSICSWNRAEKK